MASTGNSSFYNKSDFAKVIVCFLFDGSQKYTRMTLNAVNSFITNTPHVPVGLLFPKGLAEKQSIISEVRDPSRVHTRDIETHFQNWNPTQHKLDIQKFSDEFDTIFWLDSDAVVYKDLSDLLFEFHSSPCQVAFLKDHVCYNPHFLAVWNDWRKVSEPFVPQACFMGFKKATIASFFQKWQDVWRQWIEPAPFANFPNPLPSFAGSAFCTEQYALGMVLETMKPEDIYVIRRITFPLRGIPGAGGASAINQDAPSSIDWELAKNKLTANDYSNEEMRLLEQKFRTKLEVNPSNLNSSIGGSFYMKGINFSGSAFEFSGPWSSGQAVLQAAGLSFGQLSFYPSSGWETSYLFGEEFGSWSWGSYSGSFSSFGSFAGSFSSSFSGPYTSFPHSGFSYSGLSYADNSFAHSGPGWVPVDNIAGGIVHFYSLFYDQSYNWWQSNKEEVIPRLGDYWKAE
jgi:hypothetical protein